MQLNTIVDVNAHAESAWRVLGERFGDLSWTSSIDTAYLEGNHIPAVNVCRVCTTSTSFGPFPPAVVRERLTAFDPCGMTFTYIAEDGLPRFVRRAQNTWSVQSTGDRSARIESRALVELARWAMPLGLLMPVFMRNDMNRFTRELRIAVENESASCDLITTDTRSEPAGNLS